MKLNDVPIKANVNIVMKGTKVDLILTGIVKNNIDGIVLLNQIKRNNNEISIESFPEKGIAVSIFYVQKDKIPIVWEKCIAKQIEYENQKTIAIVSLSNGTQIKQRKSPRISTEINAHLQSSIANDDEPVKIRNIST